MLKTCILHIGTPKTGTTSIQATLFHNRKKLLKDGINYFNLTMTHHAVAQMFDSKDKSRSKLINHESITKPDQTKPILLTEIKKNRSKYFVISSESLGMLKEAGVRELKKFLAPHFDAFKIISYVRNPYEYASSAAQQLIKAGAVHETLYKNTLKKGSHPGAGSLSPQYKRRIVAYNNLFGKENVIVREFSRPTLKNQDVIDDFFEAAFNYSATLKNIKKLNQNDSLDQSLIKTIGALNKSIPTMKHGAKNPDRSQWLVLRLKQFSEKTNFKNKKYIAHGLNLDAFTSVIKNDLDWLHKEFGIKFDLTNPKWKNTQIEIEKIGRLVNFLSLMIDQEQYQKTFLNHHIQLLKGKVNQAAFEENISRITDKNFLHKNMITLKKDGFKPFSIILKNRILELNSTNINAQKSQ